MSIESQRDPRVVLTEDKHFTLRPKPLERWIWEQGIPAAAERVFWVHWEEGMRRRDWCSELALSHVARLCCVDISTITRAYQLLKRFGLIRREDPGRDPARPFQRAITVTEVRVPRDLLISLSRSPNRRSTVRAAACLDKPLTEARTRGTIQPEHGARLSRSQWRAVMQKLSPREVSELGRAEREQRTAMPFDETTRLDAEERAQVLAYLARTAARRPESATPAARRPSPCAPTTESRKVSPLEAARIRRSLTQAVPAGHAAEVFRQVLWSMEEGALRRFDLVHATNIALKKIREGAWTRPNRMPPNWVVSIARIDACSAA